VIGAPSKPRSVDDDEVILRLGNVVVTKTLAKFPSQTFPINGIGSVTLVPPKRGAAIVWAVIFGAIALVSFNAGSDGVGAGIFFLILCGIAALVAFGKSHELFIRTASSDTRAMEGNAKTLNQIKGAIEKAATIRG
jgi:hypothetical protein